MPNRQTKRFIDKKNSVTFHLVHRSQRDPLAADESAPQRVLLPVIDKQIIENVNNARSSKEVQHKYGIFFDDDYDYLQHLKDVDSLSTEWERVETLTKENEKLPDSGKSKINLPSSVFESNVEENIGLLNKAAPISGPILDVDPDIVAALDDDFDFENPDNQLEDDFVALANKISFENNTNDTFFNRECEISERENDEESLYSSLRTFKDEETGSRFTEYSISSNVLKRNEQLILLDDKFEKMYADYDGNEIGSLDCEDIDGYLKSTPYSINEYTERYDLPQKSNMTRLVQNQMKTTDTGISGIIERKIDSNLEKITIQLEKKNKWDCESVLSNFNNAYNHPRLISDELNHRRLKINAKTGIPEYILNGRNQNKLTTQNINFYELQTNELKSTSMTSNSAKFSSDVFCSTLKNETSQQKKKRKQALKNDRKERRKERKANIDAFKEEKKRLVNILMNEKKNIQGNRIL